MERDISTVIQHILPSPQSMLLCSQCIMRDLHKPIDNVERGGGGMRNSFGSMCFFEKCRTMKSGDCPIS